MPISVIKTYHWPLTYIIDSNAITILPCRNGPALIAMWSKALPLTASHLSPLPGSEKLKTLLFLKEFI